MIPFFIQLHRPREYPWKQHTLIETRSEHNNNNITITHSTPTKEIDDIRYNHTSSKKIFHKISISPRHTKTWSSKSNSLNETAKFKLSRKVERSGDDRLHGHTPDSRGKPTEVKSTNVKLKTARNEKIYFNRTNIPKHFKVWSSKSKSFCGGNFIGYNHEIALLHNVTVDSKAATGNKGGEDYHKLFKHREFSEFFRLKKGFMKIVCEKVPRYEFTKRNYYKMPKCCHLYDWMMSMEVQKFPSDDITVITQYYIAITRYV